MNTENTEGHMKGKYMENEINSKDSSGTDNGKAKPQIPLLDQFKQEMMFTQMTYRELSEATGNSPAWFSRVVNGDLVDPGVQRIEEALRALRNGR